MSVYFILTGLLLINVDNFIAMNVMRQSFLEVQHAHALGARWLCACVKHLSGCALFALVLHQVSTLFILQGNIPCE